MVRLLIAMRAASLRNLRHSRFGLASLVASGVVGLASALATLFLGATADLPGSGSASGACDQLALVTLSWTAGRLGFAGFTGGDPAVPLDLFRIVPVPRPALARGLLLVGLADPVTVLLAVAFAAIPVYGFRVGLLPGLVAVVAAAGAVAVVSLLGTIVAAVAPTGSRRRQDLGTLLAAVVVSAVVVLGTLIGPLLSALAGQRVPLLGTVLRVLPSGWAPDAVAGAADGSAGGTLVPLAALAAAGAGLWLGWPVLLGNRLVAQASSMRRRRTGRRRRILPATPAGSVASREVRLWIRDPNRAGFMLIALVVGLGVCLVPLAGRSTLLLPFAGLGTALIAAGIAGNGYGFDGPAIALVLAVPGAERADIRGRQLAWLALIAPYTILLSVAGLAVADAHNTEPWVLGLLPAVLGGAAGVVPLASVLIPQPLDDNGSPGPAWIVKAYVTIASTALTTLPVLALLVVGAGTRNAEVSWSATPVGVLCGAAATVLLGRLASVRLRRCGPEIYVALA